MTSAILRSAYTAKRLKGLVRWTMPALNSTLLPLESDDRRLLIIYDFLSQPFSIGDILALQEASLVLLEKHRLGTVDLAFVYDPVRPVLDPDNVTYSSITPDNVTYHLASLYPIAQINPHLGSLFVFNSHTQMERFVADNADRYCIWPPSGHYAGREYLYYTVVNDLLYAYYNEHGKIPHLSCKPLLVDWARAFYRRVIPGRVPVTVNVRKNDRWAAHRNSHIESWLAFFERCQQLYAATFVVTCAASEVDERLRRLPNVLVAKDHHTGIEQDLALLQTGAFHMGASSGPGCMVMFSAKPYLLVSTDPDLYTHLWKGMTEKDGFVRFGFSTPLQAISRGREAPDFLMQEFERRWSAVDPAPWLTTQRVESEEALTWLR